MVKNLAILVLSSVLAFTAGIASATHCPFVKNTVCPCEKCDCSQTGNCDCGAGCKCPNCPGK